MTETHIKLFYSYAHEDEKFRDELEKHLSILKRNRIITEWYDRQIKAGMEWESEINQNIEDADIILLLVSSDFLSSDYCYNIEMKKALRQFDSGKSRIVPIILRACRWELSPFSKLQVLPKDAKPVVLWQNQDKAWLNIVKSIQVICEEIKNKKAYTIINESKNDSNIGNDTDSDTISIDLKSDLDYFKNEEKKILAYKKEIYEDLIKTKNDSIPLEEKLFNQTKFKDAVDWLRENKKLLAIRACRHIYPNLSEKKAIKFTKELHRHLELILGCLLTERRNLLDEPILYGPFSAQDYSDALKFIENRIPLHLSADSVSEIKKNISYLIMRLP